MLRCCTLLGLLLAPLAEAPALDEVQALRRLVVSWRDAWEREDLRLYMACYADDFRSADMGRDKPALRAHRELVFARSEQIRVELQNLQIDTLGEQRAAVRFTQVYSSDSYADRGVKTLTLEKRSGRWWIVDESFEELPP